jgi:hypothetical protein
MAMDPDVDHSMMQLIESVLGGGLSCATCGR